MKKVNCIMLIDDNREDNYFHQRIIRKNDAANIVVVKESGEEALNYLKSKDEHKGAHPNIIFLDINMPGMNGWEFIEEYNKLDNRSQSEMIIIMLTSSDNPEDIEKAKDYNVDDFKIKPLTVKMLEEVLEKYFSM